MNSSLSNNGKLNFTIFVGNNTKFVYHKNENFKLFWVATDYEA